MPQSTAMVGVQGGVFVGNIGTQSSFLYFVNSSGHETSTNIPYFKIADDQFAVSPDGVHVAVLRPQPWLDFNYPQSSLSYPSFSDSEFIDPAVLDIYTANGELQKEIATSAYATSSALRFSPDGGELAVDERISGDGAPPRQALYRIDVVTGDETQSVVTTDATGLWTPIALDPTLHKVVESEIESNPAGQTIAPRNRLGVATMSSNSFVGNLAAPGASIQLLDPNDTPGFYNESNVAFTSGGDKVLAAGGMGAIPIFDSSASFSRLEHTYSARTAGSSTVVLSADGSVSVSSDNGGNSLQISHLQSAKQPQIVHIDTQGGSVEDLVFGISSDTVLVEYGYFSPSTSDAVSAIDVINTHDGKILLKLGPFKSACDSALCDIATGSSQTVSLSGTAASGTISAASGDETRTWQLRDDRVEHMDSIIVRNTSIGSAVLSRSGSRLTSYTYGSRKFECAPTIRSYRLTQNGWIEQRRIVAPQENASSNNGCPYFAVNSNGDRAVLSGSHGLTLWNVDTGRRLWSDQAPIGPVWFSPDAKTLYRARSLQWHRCDICPKRSDTIHAPVQRKAENRRSDRRQSEWPRHDLEYDSKTRGTRTGGS